MITIFVFLPQPENDWFDICVCFSKHALSDAIIWFGQHAMPGERYRIVSDEYGIDYEMAK